jgi:hypothetical protein
MLAKHALSQLSYGPVFMPVCGRRPSRQPEARLQTGVLKNALWPQSRLASLRDAQAYLQGVWRRDHSIRMVGLGGLEPPTSRLSSARSNQLSYKPELGCPRTGPRGPRSAKPQVLPGANATPSRCEGTNQKQARP